MFSQQIRPPIAADRRLDDGQVVARADPVEEPLVHGRHQLAVLGQQALRADQEQSVVERPRALGLALVDADRAVDAELARRRRRAGRCAARARPPSCAHRRSQNSSQPSNEAASLRPAVGRVERHEGLGKDGELDSLVGGLARAARTAFSTVASASRMTGVAWIAATRMVGKLVTGFEDTLPRSRWRVASTSIAAIRLCSRRMRFGLFYEHQLPRAPGERDEGRLLADALEQVELADRLGHRLRVGGRAPLPRGVLALERARGLPRRRQPAHQPHPPRPRDRPAPAGRQPPGAGGRAGRDARPDLRWPGRVRHRRGELADGAGRVRRGSRARSEPSGRSRSTRSRGCSSRSRSPATTGAGSRCRRETSSRSRSSGPTRRSGSRAAGARRS